jgi:hypothetical protein
LSSTIVAIALLLLPASLPPSTSEVEPVRLELDRLYETTAGTARVAPEVEALRGHRIRVAGYMVRMEEAPRGAFYLARYPVEAEEGGAGTGDLPPSALRVEVPTLAGQEVEWIPGPVEVVGNLQVGRAEDPEGRVSWLRVVADQSSPPTPPKP